MLLDRAQYKSVTYLHYFIIWHVVEHVVEWGGISDEEAAAFQQLQK